MILRRAISSDLDELVKLRIAAVCEANKDAPVTPQLIAATRSYLFEHLRTSDSFVCWIAATESAVVASASLIRCNRMPNLVNFTGKES